MRRLWAAAIAMRSVCVRRSSRARIASRMASSIRCSSVMGWIRDAAEVVIGLMVASADERRLRLAGYRRVALRFLASLRLRFTLGFS